MTIEMVLIAWGLVAGMMFVLWLVQVKTKNASFVDLGWTMGLVICAGVYAWHAEGWATRKALIFAMVFVWAFRLCSLLVRRLMKDPSEDSRYRRIREDWKTGQNFKFFWMFQFQGLLDVVLSLPFLLVCLDPHPALSWLEIFGIILWLMGLMGETAADEQMRRFKEDAANKGKTCDIGLWHFSRHPNYFFEWLIWVGYFVFALGSPWGLTAALSPILMLYFLLKVSGIPLAEAQALKTKGEAYRRYQAATSMFIPLPKRKI